jgi:hypothetical protein
MKWDIGSAVMAAVGFLVWARYVALGGWKGKF